MTARAHLLAIAAAVAAAGFTINNAGSGVSTTSSGTLVASNINAAAGSTMLVLCAGDNNGSSGALSMTTTCFDSAGNPYSCNSITLRDPGAAAAGASYGMFIGKINTALVNGSITVNFSPNTTAKSLLAYELVPASGKGVGFVTGTTGLAGSSTAPGALTAVTVNNGETVFCGVAVETNTTLTGDSDTTNGLWSALRTALANSGSDLTSMLTGGQYKTVSATGAQTWTGSLGAAKNYAGHSAIFRDVDQPVAPSTTYFDAQMHTGTASLGLTALSFMKMGGLGGVYVNGRVKHKFVNDLVFASFRLNAAAALGGVSIGIVNSSFAFSQESSAVYVGAANSAGLWPIGGWYVNNTQVLNYNAGAVGGDFDLAINGFTRRAWGRYNGGPWNNNASNDPVTGVGGVDISGLGTGDLYLAVCGNGAADQWTVNSGGSAYPFTPPSGYGNAPIITSYSAFDPAKKASGIALSNGNRTATHSGTNIFSRVGLATSKSSGKFYYEYKFGSIVNVGNLGIGLAQAGTDWTTADGSFTWLGYTGEHIAWYPGQSATYHFNALAGSFAATVAANGIVGVAYDLDAKLIWHRYANGNWNGNATYNPATGIGGYSFANASGAMVPAICLYAATEFGTINVGDTVFSGAPPSGFLPAGIP